MLFQEKTSKLTYISLCFLTGFLLFVAWPPIPLNFIVFFGFIPLLSAQDRLVLDNKRRQGWRLLLLGFISFAVWNTLTTYWVAFASLPGAVAAIILNSLLMCLPWLFFAFIKKNTSRLLGYLSLVAAWMCLEYLQLNWDSPWPWLNLGNVFATSIPWIQWYEYTGIFGGTLWIWLLNILVYEILVRLMPSRFPAKIKTGSKSKLYVVLAILFFAVPIIISYLIKPKNPALLSKGNVVVVQPNIDPYSTKFDVSTLEYQINTLISLSEKKCDSNTVLLVWPETAISQALNEDNIYFNELMVKIDAFLQAHPHLKLLSGADTYKIYKEGEKHSITARQMARSPEYFDLFNSAILVDTSEQYYVYHKSKLVPGVEKMPYPQVFGFLEDLAIDLGGTSGSLGSQDSAMVFPIDNKMTAAPVICYESIFGEYVAEYVRKGANFIVIITNDGWWKNSAGYKQHLHYAALRAVETRTMIARSANTGVSAFILPSGTIFSQTEFWKQSVIKSPFILNNTKTFYVLHGDYIARFAIFISVVLLILAFVGRFLKYKAQ